MEFLLDAMVEASKILDLDAGERDQWAEVRKNLAPYPKTQGPYGEVWLDVLNAPAEHVYNIPVTLAPVFPGEQVEWAATKSTWKSPGARRARFAWKAATTWSISP